MIAPEPYPHAERDLAGELGLPHEKLKALRKEKLTPGDDWQPVKGVVRYSARGRDRVLAALQVPAAEEKCAPEAPAPAPEPAPPEAIIADLVVSKRYTINTRIVEAKHGADTVRVRMRTNVNMRPGMTMKCRHVQGDLWDLVQRLPRWPGKW